MRRLSRCRFLPKGGVSYGRTAGNGANPELKKEVDVKGWWHEQRTRERAYEIWERAERPEGKATEHWVQAEAEIAAEEQGLEREVELEHEGVV